MTYPRTYYYGLALFVLLILLIATVVLISTSRNSTNACHYKTKSRQEQSTQNNFAQEQKELDIDFGAL
jgi:hypothetical protein